MSAVKQPVRVEVPVHDMKSELPAELVQRLEARTVPTADALDKDFQRRELLRLAHLEAVKERASRDVQRAADAAARKRRADYAEAQKVVLKLAEQAVRAETLVVSQHETRAEEKAKREALAMAVAIKRKSMNLANLKRGVDDASRALAAVEKREALVQAVADKGSATAAHAKHVVAAKKEKAAEEASGAAERLAARIQAAEVRRQSETALKEESLHKLLEKSKKVAAARQAADVELALKRVAQQAAMTKAVQKRDGLLSTIADAAALFNEHAKDVALSTKAALESAESAKMAQHFERMVSAEVAREMTLRAKQAGGAVPGYHPEVIEVPVGSRDGGLPHTELLRRLTIQPQTLLATAAARQLSAFTKRESAFAEQHKASVDRVAKLAAAAKRRATRRAEKLAKINAKTVRADAILDSQVTIQAKLLAKEMALSAMVCANREAADAEQLAKGEIYQDRCDEADERRGKHMRIRAKAGVGALRANLATSRRAALAAIVQKNGELNVSRCMQAETVRQAELGAKVAAAKEASAKREMPVALE